MASTNKTTHYDLSQFIANDKPTFLGDYNNDMSKIDTAINNAQDSADTASTAATNAQIAAEGAQTTANTAVTNAASADTKATTANTNIGTMANLETVDKTSLVNAVNEVNGKTVDNLTDINLLKTAVENLEPVLLYESDSENGTSTITLSETAANFKELQIEFYNTVLEAYETQEMYDPNGKNISLTGVQVGNNANRIFLRIINVNGTLVSTVQNNLAYTNSSNVDNNPAIRIRKIYGIRN